MINLQDREYFDKFLNYVYSIRSLFYHVIHYISQLRKLGEQSSQHIQLKRLMIDGERCSNFGSLLQFNKIVVHYCTPIYYVLLYPAKL